MTTPGFDVILDYSLKGGDVMALSYKKLFKLLIDRNMKKKDLCKKAGISTTSVSKLAKNQNVNTEIIEKVCEALECEVEDIMEFVHENKVAEGEKHE